MKGQIYNFSLAKRLLLFFIPVFSSSDFLLPNIYRGIAVLGCIICIFGIKLWGKTWNLLL
jgi:hypothetical protein